ncbi:tetratricopeptide repeat protein [Rubripirellula reticaptiva]|uniref:Tetratricopeptide repeat protein n=1 Tax=Rubripirellula reticaptiva TaxID=2528013 RepID=A0A5C6F4W6_9BACT|nr:tetratricopeptide repeat protein [Rubripirellula reticaptiva]TWU55497.1 Tetratricopeptide repeat protein [Rubripirellula reticaptiva]
MTEYLNPVKWMRWASQFTSNWFLSLPVRDLPKAALAVAVLGLLAICAIAANSESSDWRGRLLDRQLISAFERDDFGTAELVLNRKIRKTPDDPQLLFRLGLAKYAQDEKETAIDLMRLLVKSKRHDPAARWLLFNKFLNKDWSTFSDDDKTEFGQLLAMVHKEAPNEIAIKQVYAEYLIASKDYSKAIPLLDDLSRTQPMRGLQAAVLAREQGNDALADRLARRTLESVERLFEEEPNNVGLVVAVSQNQMFLNRYAEAVRTLEAGISRATKEEDKRILSAKMGDCIVMWVGEIEKASTTTEKERLRVLKMLQVALVFAPQNPRVLTLVADKVLATLNDDDEQIAAVRNALVSGSSPGIAHFIRGTAALMEGEVDRAQTSLSLAAKELPQSGAILNNLAVALSMQSEDNLERALKISDQAILQTINATPHFYETRGQILFRLKRFKEAIPDLERAVSVPSLAKNAHLSLAECYEQIGDDEIAEMHLEASKKEISDPAEEVSEANESTDGEAETSDAEAETAEAELETTETETADADSAQ